MPAKRFDPKAKARKQKIVAAVLGVVFLGVLAFQAPTILGLFGGGSPEVASEPAPASTTPTSAPPPTGAPTPPAPPASSGGAATLIDSDPAPQAASGQLVTFDRFESKDPFAQQAEESPRASAPAESGKPKGEPAISTNDPAPPPEVRAPRPAPSPAGTATISVNGVSSTVGVDDTFPETDPIFKLVSLTATSVRIGIVDGTYATGAPAITLKRGAKPLTLMNTADGTTYVLRLVSVK